MGPVLVTTVVTVIPTVEQEVLIITVVPTVVKHQEGMDPAFLLR